jgi:hypothetical protein
MAGAGAEVSTRELLKELQGLPNPATGRQVRGCAALAEGEGLVSCRPLLAEGGGTGPLSLPAVIVRAPAAASQSLSRRLLLSDRPWCVR